MMGRYLAALLILGGVGCMNPEVPEVVTGEWGGVHLGMVASESGAELEYDCAAGRIEEPILPDANGRFVAFGRHFPGHGGPIRIDETQEFRPARYEGRVQGMAMTLTVILTDTQETLGSFGMVRGASPHVLKCL